MSGLDPRQEQRSRTRERIREAVVDLLATEDIATVSVPDVARRAGVSLRTVYRHFPTKAELLHSASHWHNDRARARSRADVLRPRETRVYLEALWSEFSENVAGIRMQHFSPLGRELRAGRLAEFRSSVDESLSSRLDGLEATRRREVVDMVLALSSSSMFLELVDRMGYSSDDAARLASEMTAAVTRTYAAGSAEGRPPAVASSPTSSSSSTAPLSTTAPSSTAAPLIDADPGGPT